MSCLIKLGKQNRCAKWAIFSITGLLKVESEPPLASSSRPSSSVSNLEDEGPDDTSATCDDGSQAAPGGRRKRRVAEAELVRVPLRQGWRRQTCLRQISASGVRGDVVYFGPCGKRLSAYSDVLRVSFTQKLLSPRWLGNAHVFSSTWQRPTSGISTVSISASVRKFLSVTLCKWPNPKLAEMYTSPSSTHMHFQ